jgi:hypothetical protein
MMAKSSNRKKEQNAEPSAEEQQSDALAPAQKKRLQDYEQTHPVQLSLFELLQPEEQGYSNTIELYDFMPKYHWGRTERVAGKYLDSLEREFECRGKKYKIEVQPANIKDKKGMSRSYYPSKREELVEDALRRFATAKQGIFLDDRASVTFTLYQLQQELKRNGHSYSKDQIKEALLICAKTSITVTTEDGGAVLISNLFETLGLQTREDWEGSGEKTKAFVRFNSLVSEGIKQGNFRQLDYEKAMSYSSVVARQLHKRMSHHYVQASFTNPYSIMLSTIIRDFGLTEYQRPSQNHAQVIKALDEMKMKDVILNYEVVEIKDPTNRNKLIEAKYTIKPHLFFINEIKKANFRKSHIDETLGLKPKSLTGGKKF